MDRLFLWLQSSWGDLIRDIGLVALGAGVAGLVLPVARARPLLSLSARYRPWLGNFELYTYRSDGLHGPVLTRSHLFIAARLFGPPRITIDSVQRDDLRVFTLKGCLRVTRKNLLLKARLKKRTEEMLAVLERDMGHDGVVTGRYCTVDVALHPISGSVVMSKHALQDDEVARALGPRNSDSTAQHPLEPVAHGRGSGATVPPLCRT